MAPIPDASAKATPPAGSSAPTGTTPSPGAAEQCGTAASPSTDPRPARGVPTLRALRMGSLIACLLLMLAPFLLIVRTETAIDIPLANPTIFHSPHLWLLTGFAGWLLTGPFEGVSRGGAVIAVLVIASAMAAGTVMIASIWWDDYLDSSISVLPLLCATAAIPAMALTLTLDIVLRCLRPRGPAGPGCGPDPARWGTPLPALKRLVGLNRSRHRAPRPTPAHLRAIAIACAPALILGALALGIHRYAQPTTVVGAAPQDPLPEPPATIGTHIAWDTEVPGTIQVLPAATGPIVVSRQGITALSPSDGSQLWDYQRAADYSAAVVSPDGRHLAVRIPAPKHVDQPATTVVLNTLTGATVLERVSSGHETLQLTDSAILDGDTALSLADGSLRWRLGGDSGGRGSQDHDGCRDHQGPAGHASFILECETTSAKSLEIPWSAHIDIIVAPDTDPTRTTRARTILYDPFSERLPIIDGWALQGTAATENDDGWVAQAVSLDSLAGLDDTGPTDMGATSGVNSSASMASGTLVTYPPYGAEQDMDSVNREPGTAAAQMIFDPRTLTTRPASQDPGLGGASLGVVPTNEGEAVGGAISLRSGDGSTEATIPLAQSSTYMSPAELVGTIGPPLPIKRIWAHRYPLQALRTPGATIVVLDTAAGVPGGDGIGSWRKPSTHRIFAITEGSR